MVSPQRLIRNIPNIFKAKITRRVFYLVCILILFKLFYNAISLPGEMSPSLAG
jgi:hypothetical protein